LVKYIANKTHYEIDLETEPVSDPITFNINILFSDEEYDLEKKRKKNK